QPGCRGAAAKLPKKPGIQTLTPPSSAFAALAKHANATAPQMSADEVAGLRPPLCAMSISKLAIRNRRDMSRPQPSHAERERRLNSMQQWCTSRIQPLN